MSCVYRAHDVYRTCCPTTAREEEEYPNDYTLCTARITRRRVKRRASRGLIEIWKTALRSPGRRGRRRLVETARFTFKNTNNKMRFVSISEFDNSVLTVQLNENGNARLPPAAPRLLLSAGDEESDAVPEESPPSVNELPPSTGLVTLPKEQWCRWYELDWWW